MKSAMLKCLGMKYLPTLIFCFVLVQTTRAQNTISLKDLTAFKDAGKTWKMAGAVTADLDKPNVLNLSPGSGILVNLPDKKNHGADLFTREVFGDLDLELDYMMAKGSNSGIYLHGRYEVQLHDSWGSKNPTSGKNGGIYERWDDNRPNGEKGYEGYAPRQNASRAPGLWQHLRISFQAPRFNAAGEKIESAKILRVELNGVLVHENVELSGPTRGGSGAEGPAGPLRFQGDHGAVAFRNIKVVDFGNSRRKEEEADKPYRVYPILVQTSESPVFRSFTDLPGGVRVVHAVSVSSDENVHYSYDADTGTIIQLWRGGFLDATPMWYSRGDGSSRPVGAVQTFGHPVPAIAKLSSPDAPWKRDTTGSGFRPKGYQLLDDNKPVFRYLTYGVSVDDATLALADGQGISREITIRNPVANLFVRLAQGETIADLGKGMYLVDNNSYYLRLDEAGGAKPIVRDANGMKELIIPVSSKLKYSILF